VSRFGPEPFQKCRGCSIRLVPDIPLFCLRDKALIGLLCLSQSAHLAKQFQQLLQGVFVCWVQMAVGTQNEQGLQIFGLLMLALRREDLTHVGQGWDKILWKGVEHVSERLQPVLGNGILALTIIHQSLSGDMGILGNLIEFQARLFDDFSDIVGISRDLRWVR